MPVPFPTEETVNLERPTADESQFLADGIATAVAGREGLLPVQRALIEAMFHSMTGYDVQLDARPVVAPGQCAAGMARRSLDFRTRTVQNMLLCALVRRPLPEDVIDAIAEYAREVQVEEEMVHVAQDFAAGSLGLAAIDFARNGYTKSLEQQDEATAMHSSRVLEAWEFSVT